MEDGGESASGGMRVAQAVRAGGEEGVQDSLNDVCPAGGGGRILVEATKK